MSATERDRQETGGDASERSTETKAETGRRTRGGTSYQHSLSARGIKSSGRARCRSDEDLHSSMERLERATRMPSFEDENEEGRRRARAYGRDGGTKRTPARTAGGAERRVRGPRFDW